MLSNCDLCVSSSVGGHASVVVMVSDDDVSIGEDVDFCSSLEFLCVLMMMMMMMMMVMCVCSDGEEWRRLVMVLGLCV